MAGGLALVRAGVAVTGPAGLALVVPAQARVGAVVTAPALAATTGHRQVVVAVAATTITTATFAAMATATAPAAARA